MLKPSGTELKLLPVLDAEAAAAAGGMRVVDVGTRAGFPAVVSAIEGPGRFRAEERW